ncbi:hypothetical protein [Pyxidicoccus xibeiensis]|uniref:hypothetical protein n=1 Tax=Pyxidicoccus xibeiensis TaxID=2906759 RepID=UPI0020A73645|nr:hypothetical protein [Pyxidicoccus xibeiensis]MCP3143572.1 hypothetical protein [Pyxidicoccus xibeiensis]
MQGYWHHGGTLHLENFSGNNWNNKIAFVELTRIGPLPLALANRPSDCDCRVGTTATRMRMSGGSDVREGS